MVLDFQISNPSRSYCWEIGVCGAKENKSEFKEGTLYFVNNVLPSTSNFKKIDLCFTIL